MVAAMPFPTAMVRAIYDRRARTFDRFVDVASFGLDRGLRDRYASRLTGPVVVDVGCGTGRDAAALPGAVFVGVDLSRGMLRRAPRGPRFHYIQADAAHLPVKRADAVLCTYTLSNVADWRAALREMLRVLRPGGRLLIAEDRLPPGWYLGPWPMLVHLARFGWASVEGPLWSRMTAALTACRRGSALFGLLFWMEGTKSRFPQGSRSDPQSS